MTIASIIANVESEFGVINAATESAILQFIAAIKTGAQLLESDIQSGLKWIANEAPGALSVLQETQTLVGTLQAAGVTIPASVVNDAQAAAAGITAVAAAENAGQDTATTMVAGFVAVKAAVAAQANAALAVAQAAPVPKAS